MPTAHTSQTPSSGNLDNGAAIALGVRFTVASATTCSAVAFYAPTTNSGTYTAGLYETTADDDPTGTGTGTLLASASLGSGSVTGGAWNNISITPQSLSTGTVYTAVVHSSSGRYVATSGGLASAISNGGVTLLADGSDPNPPGLGTMRNGVFDENASLLYPNETFGQSDYFIDVILGVDATVTPGVISAAVSMPAAAASAGSTVTPAAISASTSVPAATASASSTATPAAIAGSTTMPAAAASAGSTVTPAAISASTSVPAATASAGSTVTPSAIAGSTTIPAPTITGTVSTRDILLRVGPPETKWHAGTPGTKWHTGVPEV